MPIAAADAEKQDKPTTRELQQGRAIRNGRCRGSPSPPPEYDPRVDVSSALLPRRWSGWKFVTPRGVDSGGGSITTRRRGSAFVVRHDCARHRRAHPRVVLSPSASPFCHPVPPRRPNHSSLSSPDRPPRTPPAAARIIYNEHYTRGDACLIGEGEFVFSRPGRPRRRSARNNGNRPTGVYLRTPSSSSSSSYSFFRLRATRWDFDLVAFRLLCHNSPLPFARTVGTFGGGIINQIKRYVTHSVADIIRVVFATRNICA